MGRNRWFDMLLSLDNTQLREKPFIIKKTRSTIIDLSAIVVKLQY
jgi:hypothetical protein